MEKKIENWEKQFDKMALKDNEDYYDEIDDDDYKELKSFIRQLLKQEKEKLIHDHEILINTIVDTKNREIKKLKGRGQN